MNKHLWTIGFMALFGLCCGLSGAALAKVGADVKMAGVLSVAAVGAAVLAAAVLCVGPGREEG